MKALLMLALVAAAGAAKPELSFRFVVPCMAGSQSFTFVYHGDVEPMCLEDAPALVGSDFAGVTKISDKVVSVGFSADGMRKLSHLTASNRGRRLAVVFGDKILEAPWIRQQAVLLALIIHTEIDKTTLAALIADYPPPKTP
jgi:preprotein translocase subunit SecD